MTQLIQTSAGNPLRIATVPAGGGAIGITFAPGKQQSGALTGTHRRDLGADLDVVAAWNAAAVITLIEPHELEALALPAWERRCSGVTWSGTTGPSRITARRTLRSWRLGRPGLLPCGGHVLIHCKGGLGRAGMVSARLLVETGLSPADAIAAVRVVRSGAIETSAQRRWVEEGRTQASMPPSHTRDSARDRAVGALLGLATGDALGAAIEFESKPRFARLTGLVAGGPHRLKRGQWTDDTAMALALADSLIAAPALDPVDLMQRFLDWRDTGAYSCTGTCFDIGNQTSAALELFRRSGNPLAGSDDPAASGNGALMRLAPVAIRHWRDRDALLHAARLQTRTTHGSPVTMAASCAFSEMLADAIAGVPLLEILASPAAASIEGGWRGLHRDAVTGGGWVVQAIHAAVWAVSRSTSFRSAVLLAANLGQDADTTAAIAGQLAGVVYGASAIPADWLAALAWRKRIEDTAGQLFEASWPA